MRVKLREIGDDESLKKAITDEVFGIRKFDLSE